MFWGIFPVFDHFHCINILKISTFLPVSTALSILSHWTTKLLNCTWSSLRISMATQAYAFWGHLTGKLFRYHGDKSSLWDKWTNWNLTESSKKRVKTKHHQISVLLNPETTFELADGLNSTQIESESSRLQRRGSYAAAIRVISTFSSHPL